MLAWTVPSQCPREQSRAGAKHRAAPRPGCHLPVLRTSLSGLRARGCSREGVGTLLEADGGESLREGQSVTGSRTLTTARLTSSHLRVPENEPVAETFLR